MKELANCLVDSLLVLRGEPPEAYGVVLMGVVTI